MTASGSQVDVRRVALVTGGAVGIGHAISVRLASEGIDVAIGYHTRPPDATLEAINGAGGNGTGGNDGADNGAGGNGTGGNSGRGTAVAFPLDVTSGESIGAVVGDVVWRFGRLDILVNNAGGLVARTLVDEMSDEHWAHVIKLNLTSVFACTRAAIPHLGEGGRIINISSLAALNGGGTGASAYAAAKAGVVGFTYATAKELGHKGVTVNAITPGFIDDTPFHETFSSPEAREAMVSSTAVGRPGTPDDVASVVSYLASLDSGFVSGAVIDLNGGSYFR